MYEYYIRIGFRYEICARRMQVTLRSSKSGKCQVRESSNYIPYDVGISTMFFFVLLFNLS